VASVGLGEEQPALTATYRLLKDYKGAGAEGFPLAWRLWWKCKSFAEGVQAPKWRAVLQMILIQKEWG
jgi:hypothetical protein